VRLALDPGSAKASTVEKSVGTIEGIRFFEN
jgi:hypothetical protein